MICYKIQTNIHSCVIYFIFIFIYSLDIDGRTSTKMTLMNEYVYSTLIYFRGKLRVDRKKTFKMKNKFVKFIETCIKENLLSKYTLYLHVFKPFLHNTQRLSLSLSVCLYLYLSIYLSIYLSLPPLFLSPSSLSPPHSLCLSQSVCLCLSLSISLSLSLIPTFYTGFFTSFHIGKKV